MYKKCSKCKEDKLFSEFSKNKTKKDGYQDDCKVCKKSYLIEYRINNKDKILESQRIYQEKYKEINKHKIAEFHKKYQQNNKDKFNFTNAKRRAARISATPDWLSKDQLDEIRNFYRQAQKLKEITGQEYHVDHIVPLQGENVCGLHVPWNLQILTAEQNRFKSNKLLEE